MKSKEAKKLRIKHAKTYEKIRKEVYHISVSWKNRDHIVFNDSIIPTPKSYEIYRHNLKTNQCKDYFYVLYNYGIYYAKRYFYISTFKNNSRKYNRIYNTIK